MTSSAQSLPVFEEGGRVWGSRDHVFQAFRYIGNNDTFSPNSTHRGLGPSQCEMILYDISY